MLGLQHQLSAPDIKKPTIGQISFINTLPLTLPLEKEYVSLEADIVLANPNKLNMMFQRRELDIGAMSSFFYLADGSFEIFPDISISCLGAVGSVLLFSKPEASKLDNQVIAVPDSSATSINLLSVLLKEEHGVNGKMQPCKEPSLQDPEIKGLLLIGDQALKKRAELEANYHCYDLGLWWHRLFALPMVFGVWAARRSWIQGNKEIFENTVSCFQHSLKLGLGERFPEVLTEASRRSGLDQTSLIRYYRQELNYEFSPDHKQGLSLYGSLCKKHKLFD